VLTLVFVALRRAVRIPVSPVARLLLPERGDDWTLFVPVSLTGGLVEEFVLRGFCLGVLLSLFPSLALAVAIVSVMFGLGHVAQDRLGALRAAVLGAVLAVPVLATGSLLPSILAHAATNLLTPLWSGLLIEIPKSDATPTG
jgi:membrane protease YdiL (CAAX protease family)